MQPLKHYVLFECIPYSSQAPPNLKSKIMNKKKKKILYKESNNNNKPKFATHDFNQKHPSRSVRNARDTKNKL